MALIKVKTDAHTIFEDLQMISAQLGVDVVCMIAAKCLHTHLVAGEWDEIKKQLEPKQIRKSLTELKGGK